MAELDDEQKVKQKGTLDNIRRRRELFDTAKVLSTIEGRRFYWRWLQRCGVFRSSFTGNNTTFFNEGERNIGLEMLADVNEADPEKYLLMLTESQLEERKNG